MVLGVVGDVVGADHEHDDLGCDAFELAVVEPPEEVLGVVAADGEIGRLSRGVVPNPNGPGGGHPGGRDRVTQEQQINIPASGGCDERLMQLEPGTRPGLGHDRRVGGGRCLSAADGQGDARENGQPDSSIDHRPSFLGYASPAPS